MNDQSELEKQNRELAILNTIARELNKSLSLEETLNIALAQTAELLNLETGWIYLVDRENQKPILMATQNLPPGMKEHPEIMTGWCHCLRKFMDNDLGNSTNVDIENCSRLSKLDNGKSGLKYHASIPIISQHGKKHGVLNVASKDWKKLTPRQLKILNTIGDLLGIAVERSRLFQQIQKNKQIQIDAMKKELQIAHDMQMALLPGEPPPLEGAELAGTCIPAKEVGGDYYSYLYLGEGDNQLAIVIADVSGKGMQAATITLRFNEMLRYEARGLTNPTEILKGLDSSIGRSTPLEMFITAGIAVLDTNSMNISIASAANPVIHHYCRKDDEVRALEVNGLPLGLPGEVEVEEPFREMTLQPGEGDILVFASDGVEEARNAGGSFYGGKRLSRIIRHHATGGESSEQIRDGIVNDVHRFMDTASQTDDITVVVLKVLEKE